MFLASEIISFELVAEISPIYDENTWDLQSECYHTILTFRI